MCKLPSRKLLATLVAGALFLPHTGFTLGLGEIEVNSALNQKLNADIELLSAEPEDTENIIIKLASRKEFIRAGLDRPYLLSDLRFKAETINGIPYIKVSSGSPIREPFLNFLVEIDWPNGHLLREYTVLLDPPVFMMQSAGTASAAPAAKPETSDGTGFRPAATTGSSNIVPVTASVPGSAAVSQQRSPATTTFMPAPVVQKKTPINQPVGSYRIKAGETAWSLADAMRPDQNISVQQMMIALLRANPESFINENVNGIKRGYILRMPDYSQITAISDAEARAMVKQQSALWRQYLQSQSGQPVSAMQADDSASSTADGEGENQGAGEAAGKEAYLEIVSAGSGASTAGIKDPAEMSAQELRAELMLARERVETERVEKEALQQRVNMLEQNTAGTQGLLSIEDEELSRVQSLNMPSDAAVETPADPDSAADADSAAEAGSEVMDSDAVDTVADEAAETLAEDQAEGISEESEAAEEAVFADEVTEQTDDSMAETPVTKPASAVEPPRAQPDQKPAADLLTQLLNDPVRLATAGGGLLLIAALIGIMIRRRKAAENDAAPAVDSAFKDLEVLADEQSAESTAAEEQLDVESHAAAQAEDESAKDRPASTQDTAVNETEAVAAEADEVRDDVIAEADVYLAYGIYQQAEELLTKAINENPERNDYRVKLAETHYTSKNADAFVETAAQLKQHVDSDDSPDWEKIMVMGQDLCPDNPMFQGGTVEELNVDDIAPEVPSMDFDLGTDETEGSSTESDLDLKLDDESLELPEAVEDMVSEDTLSLEAADEIEFDLSDTGAVEETAELEDEFSLDIDASELGIDIEDESGKAQEGAEEQPGSDTQEVAQHEEEIIADSSNKVIELPVAEAEEKDQDQEEVILDLTDEVDIESLEMDEINDSDAGAEDISAEEDEFDLSSLDDVDEISTKLDLARAYLDMGDHEGTRGILEEVLVDGNDEQKQEANELIAKLG